jgi:hypothetical protein
LLNNSIPIGIFEKVVRVAKKGRTTFSNIPIGILMFNKIRDENDEGDFSDRREIMYRL